MLTLLPKFGLKVIDLSKRARVIHCNIDEIDIINT